METCEISSLHISDPKADIDQSCKAAETFSKLYYETMDKRRHLLSKFYMRDASLVWNGNNVVGDVAIGQFYETLPVSESTVISLSSIPVADVAVNGQTTILVQTAGQLHFKSKLQVPFFQTFLLTIQEDKWKVLSDTFRFQEIV